MFPVKQGPEGRRDRVSMVWKPKVGKRVCGGEEAYMEAWVITKGAGAVL